VFRTYGGTALNNCYPQGTLGNYARTGMMRNITAGEGITDDKVGVPMGYGDRGWIMPQKAGMMSSRLIGLTVAAAASGVLGMPGEGSATITFTVPDVEGQLIVSGAGSALMTFTVADALGVRVHVVQSGPMKAGAVDGVPVTAEVLDETQRIVDALAADFFAAVGHGRRLRGKALDSVTSGEVWTAGEAQGVGLLDEVGSAEAAMIGLEKAIRQRGTPRRDRAAAARRMLDLR
jgi:hypothetical protein